MSNRFLVKSPCKINLSLTIHNKRSDGFHSLTSIFQLIDLYDEIYIEIDNSNQINLEGDFNCDPVENLIYLAIVKYKEATKLSNGFNISVIKRVPSGGGLGGGSGNAGAILLFLNNYFKKLDSSDLNRIALELGSDVPFFINHPTALVKGRGEIISRLQTIDNYYILLVNPGIHISTAKAFKAISDNGLNEEESEEKTIELQSNYEKGVKYFHNFKNSFENALHKDYNFINDIKGTLKGFDVDFVSLSGSGSTMFGIFTNYDEALKAEEVLSIKNYKINLVKPLASFYEYIEI